MACDTININISHFAESTCQSNESYDSDYDYNDVPVGQREHELSDVSQTDPASFEWVHISWKQFISENDQ